MITRPLAIIDNKRGNRCKEKAGRNEWKEITPYGRTRWMDRMCIDLINSRNEAKLQQDSDDCPVEGSGRKNGIMDSWS